jgi:ABC-type siderophore export system fused ATPase/permease subunit
MLPRQVGHSFVCEINEKIKTQILANKIMQHINVTSLTYFLIVTTIQFQLITLAYNTLPNKFEGTVPQICLVALIALLS